MSQWHNPTARERLAILRATSSVAIVGMSADTSRASYFVATYLLSSSCSFDHVWFVNPKGGEILGRPVYPSLADLPGAPDLVDVFRRAEDLPAVAEEVVAVPGTRTFWAQLGLTLRRGRRDRHGRRSRRRDGPLPEDRARPLPRAACTWPASTPVWSRRNADHLCEFSDQPIDTGHPSSGRRRTSW